MFEFLQNNIFIAVGFAITSGVLVRIAFSLVGQRWVRTYHHTVTFALLPVIALIITKVIAGKLSLVWLSRGDCWLRGPATNFTCSPWHAD
jgi:hypothetical protein